MLSSHSEGSPLYTNFLSKGNASSFALTVANCAELYYGRVAKTSIESCLRATNGLLQGLVYVGENFN